MDFASSKIPVNIEDEMKRSYMDYAMSVIIGRALPDVRDGLKPAHRRVLYGMRLMGLASNRAYRKCAKIVGEVMGNFHPHGDASIYDTLVRLSQDFNMRYPLVDGQGNFGSVDGDPPAAMRYTEARLQALAEELMAISTRRRSTSFRTTTRRPKSRRCCPRRFPTCSSTDRPGIAVGMATNIPPHNLREVIDGIVYVIGEQQKVSRRIAQGLPASNTSDDGERTTTRDERLRQLLRIVTGPDFPTGGYIVGRQGIVDAFRTGRGSVLLRARHELEQSKKGDKTSIVVSEIPYQVNKARLIEKIADLVRDKAIEGISDLRDESDRDGMRIVIELKRGEMPEVVLNNLYKHTAAPDQLRHHHARDRRRAAARAEPARVHRAVHRVPPRGRAPPHRVRAPQGRGARAHPRGSADRARSPRRRDRAHPRLQEHAGGARRPDAGIRAVAGCRRRRFSRCSSSV